MAVIIPLQISSMSNTCAMEPNVRLLDVDANKGGKTNAIAANKVFRCQCKSGESTLYRSYDPAIERERDSEGQASMETIGCQGQVESHQGRLGQRQSIAKHATVFAKKIIPNSTLTRD